MRGSADRGAERAGGAPQDIHLADHAGVPFPPVALHHRRASSPTDERDARPVDRHRNRVGAGGTVGSRAVATRAAGRYTNHYGTPARAGDRAVLYGNAGYAGCGFADGRTSAPRPTWRRIVAPVFRCRCLSPMPRLIRASSAMPRPGSARSLCLRGKFCHRRGDHPAFPTRGPGRRSSTCSAGAFPWLRAGAGDARERQDRQAAHAGGDQRGALDLAAGRADHRGGRAAWLRGGAALRPGRAPRRVRSSRVQRRAHPRLGARRWRRLVDAPSRCPRPPRVTPRHRPRDQWSKVVKASGESKAE